MLKRLNFHHNARIPEHLGTRIRQTACSGRSTGILVICTVIKNSRTFMMLKDFYIKIFPMVIA